MARSTISSSVQANLGDSSGLFVTRPLQWGLKAERIHPEGTGEAIPCAFWCEGCAGARRRRSFAGGHAERWRGEDRH